MFRRRIIINKQVNASHVCVRAALEDDFHHFRVEVVCAGGRVTSVDANGLRTPYSLCGEASAHLDRLVGMPVTPVAHEVTRVTDANDQCTHMFELAGLAIAAAARSAVRRQYDISVPMPVDGRTQARLSRDGVPWLEWDVQGTVIQGPAPYAGVDIYRGMARWALGSLSADEAEAALVLRRCTGISKGRGMKLDDQIHAVPNAHCFSQQPVRATLALRMKGSTWDFAGTSERLCASDAAWLDFEPVLCA